MEKSVISKKLAKMLFDSIVVLDKEIKAAQDLSRELWNSGVADKDLSDLLNTICALQKVYNSTADVVFEYNTKNGT